MPATERITLQNRPTGADKVPVDILTIGGQLVEISQFSATGEELQTDGVSFKMKYTPGIAAAENTINGFSVAGQEYKLTDKKRDRKYFTIIGERSA